MVVAVSRLMVLLGDCFVVAVVELPHLLEAWAVSLWMLEPLDHRLDQEGPVAPVWCPAFLFRLGLAKCHVFLQGLEVEHLEEP